MSKKVNGQKLETVLQRGHLEAVKCIEFSPNGVLMASAGRDKMVVVWDVAKNRQIKTFLGHTSTITTLAFSPNGQYLVSGDMDHQILVWDIANGTLKTKYQNHRDRITQLIFYQEEWIASGGWDDSVHVWNVFSGEVWRKFPVDPDKGLGKGVSLAKHPSLPALIIGQDNRSFQVWDVEKNKKISSHRAEKEGYNGGSIEWVGSNFKDRKLYSMSNNGGLYRWASDLSQPEAWLSKDEKGTGMCFKVQNEQILCVLEKKIEVWNGQDGKKLWSMERDSLPFLCGSFHPDGKRLALAGDDKNIYLYDIASKKLLDVYKGLLNESNEDGLNLNYQSRFDYHLTQYIKSKNNFALSPDEQWIAKGKSGTDVLLLDFQTGRIAKVLKGHQKVVLDQVFSLDGAFLWTTGADKSIKKWDVRSGKCLQTLLGHREIIFDLALSADGTLLVSSDWDGVIKIWKTANGILDKTLEHEKGAVYDVEFSPNQAYLIISTLDNHVKLLEIDSKKEVKEYISHDEAVQELIFHPNGKWFASAGWDKKVCLWDMATGLMVRKFYHEDKVGSLVFGKDGNTLITAGADRTIIVWNTETGQKKQELKGHEQMIVSLALTKDQKTLISQSVDGMMVFWDLEKGTEKASLYTVGHQDWLVKTPNGYYDASDKMKSYIFFVKGLESYDLEQFSDEFYKPKLLKKVLGYEQSDDLNKKILEEIQNSPPPLISWSHSPQDFQRIDEEMTYALKVIDQGGGISDVKFLHNGKRLPFEKMGMDRSPKKGNSISMYFKVKHVPGLNKIQVSALSKAKIESKPMEKQHFLDVKAGKSKCYALIIGINTYQNPQMNLNYAQADAESMSKNIQDHGKLLFEEVIVNQLLNEKATKKNILAALESISREAKAEDVLLFYYAGHGSMAEDQFYFIPTELTRLYEDETLKALAIPVSDIKDILCRIKALKQVMIIDACHSGASTELLASRGGGEEKAIYQLSRSAGVHILASAGSEQTAGEFKDLGHGLFTYALLKGLDGSADGAPKDGKVTIYEIKSYLDDQVPELTKLYKNSSQFPHTFSRGNDFPIGLGK